MVHLAQPTPNTRSSPRPFAAWQAGTVACILCLTVLGLFLLTACGDEPVPTPPPGTAVALTAGLATPPPSATPVPRNTPTVPPSPTPSQADLESAYVIQATLIVSGVLTAPEIGDAVTAAGDAGSTALFGGNVNVNALTGALTRAADVVTAAGMKFAALTPPAAYKPMHDQMLGVFAKYDASFSQAETAINNGDWLALATATGNIAAATDELNTLLNQLNSR